MASRDSGLTSLACSAKSPYSLPAVLSGGKGEA